MILFPTRPTIFRYSSGQLATATIRNRMQKVMQDNAAVYRTQETLFEGKGLIDETVKSFRDVKVSEALKQTLDHLHCYYLTSFSHQTCFG